MTLSLYLFARYVEELEWQGINEEDGGYGDVKMKMKLLNLHRDDTYERWDMDENELISKPLCIDCARGLSCECCLDDEERDSVRFCKIKLILAEEYYGRSDFNPEWRRDGTTDPNSIPGLGTPVGPSV